MKKILSSLKYALAGVSAFIIERSKVFAEPNLLYGPMTPYNDPNNTLEYIVKSMCLILAFVIASIAGLYVYLNRKGKNVKKGRKTR